MITAEKELPDFADFTRVIIKLKFMKFRFIQLGLFFGLVCFVWFLFSSSRTQKINTWTSLDLLEIKYFRNKNEHNT